MPVTMNIIDNPASDRIRHVCDLARGKARRKTGRFLIEGPQSVREAVLWRPDVVQDIFVQAQPGLSRPRVAAQSLSDIVERSQDSTIYVHLATDEVMRRISADAQGIAAVGSVRAMHADTDDIHPAGSASVAAFWQVRDPGNAGTVIRTADAAGCDAVVFVDDCVDMLNPKVIRSTAGSLFHLPVLAMGTDEFLAWSGRASMRIIAADIYGTADRKPEMLPRLLADPAALDDRRVVLFGNEARGLPQDLLARADRIVAIPLYGRAESLNLAASAAAMLLGMAMSSRMGTM